MYIARVAQMVEHRVEDAGVLGSIPSFGTCSTMDDRGYTFGGIGAPGGSTPPPSYYIYWPCGNSPPEGFQSGHLTTTNG